jgi:hypothetical protein
LNISYATKSSSLDSLGAKSKRYGFTKLLNILFASELQLRVDAQGIDLISISLHPGVVSTGGLLSLFPGWLQPIMKPLGKTPLQGAVSSLFAATASEVREKSKKYKGRFLGTGAKKGTPSEPARDVEAAKKLWALSETTIAEILKS